MSMAPCIDSRRSLAIGVMAKAPVAGRAKTRLIPLLGDAGAARLHAGLVERTLRTCVAAAPGGVSLFVTGDGGETFWQSCRDAHALPSIEQQGRTLGGRMAHALDVLLAQAPVALLVGCDCPALNPEHLLRAADAVRSRNLVFIPALDGGYVLVGATAPCAPAFAEDIPWGTPAVMERTRSALRAIGWRHGEEWVELDPLADLDEPADYLEAVRAGWLASPPDAAAAPTRPRERP